MRLGELLLKLSCNDGPLPKDLGEKLATHLSYVHVTQLRGAAAYDRHTGVYSPTRFDKMLLHRFDSQGLLCCGLGYQYSLERYIRELGYEVDVERVTEPHPFDAYRYTVDWDKLFEKMDLRARQDEWLAAMETRDFGLIDAPTATGKTHIIKGYCLAHPRARIHVVSSSLDVLRLIRRRLTEDIANVGFVGGGEERWGRVTVLSAGSLHKIAEGFKSLTDRKSADVVICDEVQELMAPTYSVQLAKYRRAKMYGLSASLEGRSDQADKAMESLFGEVIFKMSYQEAQALDMVAPMEVQWLTVDMDENPCDGKSGIPLERWGIWRNNVRNQVIADKVNTFGPDVQVLIMAYTIDHAVQLKQFLPDFKLCYANLDREIYESYLRNRLIDPEDEPIMTPQRRIDMTRAFETGQLKKVIATDVWSTGVDFVNLSVIVRADARASKILATQIPGRAVRVTEGKESAILIDCVDRFDDRLEARSKTRRKHYKKNGWTMVGWPHLRLAGAARQ